MSGDLDDSAPRVLRDPKRKVFQTGGVDSFLLASPAPLGNLNHIRVWHDNRGKQPSWYLARIMVKDLRLDRTFYFMADRWLAVEEDDGMIERVIPVAGKSELTSFGHLFYTKTRRNLSDSHLWFSIFTRPVKSKFTRVQRATCCLSLLFCTMMANIFFYGVDFADVSGTQLVYTIGPISFTFGQVVIGVISSLMVLPINLIVVQLFRLSRPIPSCTSTRKNQAKVDKFRRTSFDSEQSSATNDLENELARMDAQESSRSIPSISLNVYSQTSLQSQPKADLLADPTSDTESPRDGQTFRPVLGFKKTRRVRKGLELPWPLCCLAWLLVVASVAVAFWLTIEVAGQFGRTKATEWLTSMCFSLIQDIFFTQPFKVLLLALFFSLVIRDPEKEENSNLVMAPHLQDDEEWLHDRMTMEELQDPAKKAELRQIKDQASAKNLAPLHPEELAEARDIRFKEIKMHKIIREIIFYLIFLNVTMLICFGDRDPNVYYVNKSMTDMFVKASYNGRLLFTKIRGRDHFWNYTENVFLPSLYSYNWYNGDPDEIGRRENFLADNNMHLIGRVRFRQLRIQKDACATPDVMQTTMKSHDCRAPYSISNEDATSYDIGWKPLNASALPNYADRYEASWKYNHWYDVSSFPYNGKHAFYNGGGYIIELGDSLAENLQIVADLQRDMWVDQHTRAVFMEFVVYNVNINMYATSFLLVEFLPQGGALPFPYFWTIRLDRYIGAFAYFVVAGQIIYTLFIVFFLFREIKNIFREKRAYFDSVWNLCEVCIIGLAVASIVFYLYRMFVGWDLMEQWRTQPKTFLNFHFVAYWDQLYGYISGFVLFLVNVKFIRLLRFNRRLLLFSMTLRQCAKDLAYYSVVFGIVFGAYALFAYAIFHLHLEDFSTFVGTLETLFSTMLGKFDFQDMISVHSFLGPAFFFTYVVIIVFIMINMFLSIIMETFGKVRHDNEAIENELEIVEFMMQRFKRWSGYSERRLIKPVQKEEYIEGIDPKDAEMRLLRNKLTTMVDRLNLFIRAERGTQKSDRRIYLSS
ncbi:polycystic kidney disease protein 1-like 2 [Patiria miniata]|uniref:PLAT domain-containing protein n=1 Tax=Patiria miniata TaxID=46514 RepID=A0A914ATB2_PATMI|nr:polycystic kidney disease protein 1-like 2 [Patiria miniata]